MPQITSERNKATDCLLPFFSEKRGKDHEDWEKGSNISKNMDLMERKSLF